MDEQVAKKVCRAYDLRILPVSRAVSRGKGDMFDAWQMAMIMYLFSALDRGNVSNAKSDEME